MPFTFNDNKENIVSALNNTAPNPVTPPESGGGGGAEPISTRRTDSELTETKVATVIRRPAPPQTDLKKLTRGGNALTVAANEHQPNRIRPLLHTMFQLPDKDQQEILLHKQKLAYDTSGITKIGGLTLSQVALEAIVLGDTNIFKQMLDFAFNLADPTIKEALDDIFTQATWWCDDKFLKLDTELNSPHKMLAVAIYHKRLNMLPIILDYLNRLDPDTKTRYLQIMLGDSLHRSELDYLFDYQNIFVFIVKQAPKDPLDLTQQVIQLIDELPEDNKVDLLNDILTRQIRKKHTTLMEIAQDNHAVFNLIIDCIWRLPEIKRKKVLQLVLQQQDIFKIPVAWYLSKHNNLKITVADIKIYMASMHIDIRVIAHSGRSFLAFLNHKTYSTYIPQEKKILLRGLYEWVTPGRCTSREQKIAIIKWFPSASAVERQFLADTVAKTDLYKQCIATTQTSGVSVLRNNPDNGAVEMKNVLTEDEHFASCGGGGGK